MTREIIVAVQAVTFVLLGVLLIWEGTYNLGFAQLLLALVTVAVYA